MIAFVLHLSVLTEGLLGFLTIFPLSNQIENEFILRKNKTKAIKVEIERFNQMTALMEDNN